MKISDAKLRLGKSVVNRPLQVRRSVRRPQGYFSATPSRPIHLTGSVTLNPQATAPINSQALHNPTGEPVELLLFKFGMFFTEATNNSGLTGNGAGLGVSISMNDIPFTNGYVPVWLFDKAVNSINEQLGRSTGTSNQAYGEFQFALPRGLLVLPEDQLTVSFQHFGTTQQAITARFSASGRTLEEVPKGPRCVPWTAGYQSKVFTNVGASTAKADNDSSTESDLANLTDGTVYLQRLTGRLNAFSNSTVPAFSDFQAASLIGAPDDIGLNLLTVQMFSGRGVPIIPYAALFRSAFPGAIRSWELDGEPLEPGDYFIARLSMLPMSAGQGGTLVETGSQKNIQATIGMTGYREMQL